MQGYGLDSQVIRLIPMIQDHGFEFQDARSWVKFPGHGFDYQVMGLSSRSWV